MRSTRSSNIYKYYYNIPSVISHVVFGECMVYLSGEWEAVSDRRSFNNVLRPPKVDETGMKTMGGVRILAKAKKQTK